MKIHVLGAGTCMNDLPVPGTQNQFPPGFFIRWGDGPLEHLMLECAEGVRFRLPQMGIPLESVRKIAISHAHPDHFALLHYLHSVSVRPMFAGESFRVPELEIYAPASIIDHWPKLWAAQFEEIPDKPDLGTTKILWRRFTPQKVGKVPMSCADAFGGAILQSRSVSHGFGRVDALGFRLEVCGKTLAYSGDTAPCTSLTLLAAGADLFICEAAARIGEGVVGKNYGHLTPFDAGATALAADAKHLLLFHHAGRDTDQAILADCRNSGYRGRVSLARDLTTIEI